MAESNPALDKTAIIITTFMRDDLLKRCVESIRKYYPTIPLFVGDNGHPSVEKTDFLKSYKCVHHQLAFDLGVSGVRNETLKLIPPKYEYLMIVEDDVVFTEKTRLEVLRAILDDEPVLGLCGCLLILKDGREQHYEGKVYCEGDTHFIEKIDDPKWKEIGDGIKYTANYNLILNVFMMRRKVWEENPWDPQFKTALEHCDFFMSLQTKTAWKVGYTKSVSMQHLPESSEDYKTYRCRPVGWKLFGEKWGLKFVNSDYNHEQPLSYEAMGTGKPVDLKGGNLKLAIDVLTANQCTWWLEAGTCLGAIREKDFIPHDPDIDIGLHPKELHLWDKLQADMMAAGFTFYRAWTHGKKNTELSFRRNGVKLDFFFFRDDGDFWWHGAFGPDPEGGWGKNVEFLPHVFSARLFKELQPITFHGLPCYVPNPPERYLLERYGGSWPYRQRGYRFWTDCRAIDRNYFKRGNKAVFIGGVWDLFHEGHVAILERAKALGTKLIVGVLTDDAAMAYKERPIIPFESRRRVVESLKCVDRVIAQNSKDPAADLVEAGLRPHYLVHGDDWDLCPGEIYVRKHGGKVVFLPYTTTISSTAIKKTILGGVKSSPVVRENKIAVGIKTFMRDLTFLKTLETYKTTLGKLGLPYRIYVADDGPPGDAMKTMAYDTLKLEGHMVITLPFDSGISLGRNAIIKQVKEQYVLISDDDVVIRDAESIKKMKAVLDENENIGLVAAMLKYDRGAFFGCENYARGLRLERRGNLLARGPAPRDVQETSEGIKFMIADQVPNIFLAKRAIFNEVMWDGRIRIEYDHMDFFLELKKTRWKAAVCLDAEATHLTTPETPEYFRHRRTSSAAYFLQKHDLRSIANQF
jgi:cytidyltransferase-like protein